jgi:DNA replication and repair protein RecF
VIIRRLWLTDFRNYESADVSFASGCTAVMGANGQGKTNLVESMSYLATLGSFRGVTSDAMVRSGAEHAVVRAMVEHDDGREMLIEAEIPRKGRHRVQVNRQRLARTHDLLGALRVSVFSPDDLVLLKGSPSERRNFLDETLVAINPAIASLLSDLDRILRQRAALLKQMGGRVSTDTELTLDVWDDKLASTGEAVASARADLVDLLSPRVTEAYHALSQRTEPVTVTYQPDWRVTGLAASLATARSDDVRRQVNSVGPHRDDIEVVLDDLPARSHASQGEQRTLALALKLAAHRLVTERHGESPVLVLDDVLSELDPVRSAALLANLPPGQILLTTASALPSGATPDQVLTVSAGRLAGPL